MFSEAKARRVTQFIECLKHTKGEFHGEPFKLLPWQEKIIRDVFGTVRDDDPSMRQYGNYYRYIFRAAQSRDNDERQSSNQYRKRRRFLYGSVC